MVADRFLRDPRTGRILRFRTNRRALKFINRSGFSRKERNTLKVQLRRQRRLQVRAAAKRQAAVRPLIERKKQKELAQKKVKVVIKKKEEKVFPKLGPRRKFVSSKQTKSTIATIKAAKPRPKPFKDLSPLQKIARRARLKKQQIIAERTKDVGAGRDFKVLKATTALLALGIGRGAVITPLQIIRNPKQAAKGFVSAVRQPKKTLKGIKSEFLLDPAGTIGEFWAFGQVLGATGTSLKRSAVGAAVSEKIFVARLPKNLRTPVSKILKATRAQARLVPKGLKKIKRVSFATVKNITKIEARALKRTLQRVDSVVFGSTAGRILSGSKKIIPKDIDIAVRSITKFNKEFIKHIPKKLRKSYKIKGNRLLRNGKTFIDIKTLDRLVRGPLPASTIARITRGRLVLGRLNELVRKFVKAKPRARLKLKSQIKRQLRGLKVSQLPRRQRTLIQTEILGTQRIVKVQGIKFVGFGEQTTRKALGTLEVLVAKNIRRIKDPQQLLTALEIQVAGLKKLRPKTKFGRKLKFNRIKVINEGIKVLKSKKFLRLLRQENPAFKRKFPKLSKINTTKLKKIKRTARSKIEKLLKKKKKPILRRKRPSKIKSRIKKRSSVVPSRLRKRKVSKIPSRLRRKKPSKLPSKPKRKRPSKVPSKPKKRRPSKAPSRPPSKVPSKPPSRVPSRTPSRTPSRVPSRTPSRPPRKIRRLPVTKPPIRKLRFEAEKKVSKVFKTAVRKRQFIFLPDLEALITGQKVKGKAARKAFLKKGRIFTGLEKRPIV